MVNDRLENLETMLEVHNVRMAEMEQVRATDYANIKSLQGLWEYIESAVELLYGVQKQVQDLDGKLRISRCNSMKSRSISLR